LGERRDDMDKLAAILLEKETLERSDLEEFFDRPVAPADEERPVDEHEVIRR
jgi:ATP-dependent Zn protease